MKEGRRLWAAIMVATDVDTCESILQGRKVMVGRLDWEVLRRAQRGNYPPPADSYIHVTADMLDAIHEAGPQKEMWP